MRWNERLVAASSAGFFAIAGALTLPAEGLAAPVVKVLHIVVGGQQLAEAADPYRLVDASPEVISAAGRRYLAAVEPGNTATMNVYAAMASGKWPAIRKACGAAVPAKKKSIALLSKGAPEWPKDIVRDIDQVIANDHAAVEFAQRCAQAKTIFELGDAPDVPRSDAPDRVRVRLGLDPRPVI